VTNIINYTPNNLKLVLSNKYYWDFYLKNTMPNYAPFTGTTSGTCFVVDFDFNNPAIFGTGTTSADTIYSTQTWTGATNTGVTANTIGITGIDNGLITFEKLSADTTNQALLSALTASTLYIPSGDTRFMMTRVTGMTEQYEYPMNFVTSTGTTGDYMDFCGGFYQGYYKLDGFDYQVLPNRVNKGWVAEFWLKKSDSTCSGTTATTLNDLYPDNKGFFFYMGTRAENKFWDVFEGLNTGCTSACTTPIGCTGTVTTFCTVPKENQIVLSSGVSLDPPEIKEIEIKNQFMIYHNGQATTTHYGISYPKGKTAPEFTGDSITITATTQLLEDNRNPFLIYCNKCNSTGCSCDDSDCSTVCDYSGRTGPLLSLDYNLDIIDNAIGFRVKDDGSIGYRLLSVTGACSGDTYISGVTVTEGYSASGMVTNDVWKNIAIRFYAYERMTDEELLCKGRRLGRLAIYVNGKVKFWVDDFLEIIPRRLDTNYQKQVAVPYNISLGGGSQGLLESMTFDGQDPEDLGLNIEKNFAGTFIGSISQFKFYACNLSWVDIENNYKQEKARYGL